MGRFNRPAAPHMRPAGRREGRGGGGGPGRGFLRGPRGPWGLWRRPGAGCAAPNAARGGSALEPCSRSCAATLLGRLKKGRETGWELDKISIYPRIYPYSLGPGLRISWKCCSYGSGWGEAVIARGGGATPLLGLEN